MFGVIMGVPAGFVCACTLPLAFRGAARARAFRTTTLTFVLTSVVLFAAWFSA